MRYATVLLLFLTQRHGMLSRVVRLLASTRFGGRAQTLVELVHDVEHRLIAFYTGQRQRFALAGGLAFGYWACGMLRTYTTMACLGRPIAWRDAWMIEAGLPLVRSVLFLVPGNLGTQEAALVMSSSAITGSSTLGLRDGHRPASLRARMAGCGAAGGLDLLVGSRRPLANASRTRAAARAGSACLSRSGTGPQVATTASWLAGAVTQGLAAAPSSGSHMSSFRITETMCL
jgi:hypothetical protein